MAPGVAGESCGVHRFILAEGRRFGDNPRSRSGWSGLVAARVILDLGYNVNHGGRNHTLVCELLE